jgi:hypothetical protein
MGLPATPLTEAQILAWADAHRARTGRWPSHGSGGVAGVPGQSWTAIDEALRRGLRGLPGGDTLSRLLDRHRRPRHRRPRPWTPEEDALVRALPAREAAQRVGRTLRAVYMRRHTLGIGPNRRPGAGRKKRSE